MGVEHDGGHAQMARVPGDWVMRIPEGLTTFDAAVIGVAGYTAALSLHLMELNGVAPDQGPIIVTGATGGVGSIAIDMLTQRSYRVVAMTGKQNEAAYLQSLGAQDVLPRVLPPDNPKSLEKAQWAGALDSVGGATLAWLTRTMQPGGVIASFGNAGGMELSTTVLPFILRGIRLIGLVANSPMPLRQEVWQKIASIYRPRHLKRIAHVIGLEALPEYHDRTLAGQTRGRTVIDMSRTT
jgi:putative YhdH/YhfP family quinone oxidoreductase